MQQIIRYNIFETNSSSTHALAIYKNTVKQPTISPKDLHYNIAIMENADGFHSSPNEILSFIYTIALLRHDWWFIDKIKETFSNCVFQKPQWELPDGEIGYCEDKEIVSWCDLVGPDFYCKYDDEDMEYIQDHLINAVLNSELYVHWDGDYEFDIVEKQYIKHEKDFQNDRDLARKWIEENLENLIERC